MQYNTTENCTAQQKNAIQDSKISQRYAAQRNTTEHNAKQWNTI